MNECMNEWINKCIQFIKLISLGSLISVKSARSLVGAVAFGRRTSCWTRTTTSWPFSWRISTGVCSKPFIMNWRRRLSECLSAWLTEPSIWNFASYDFCFLFVPLGRSTTLSPPLSKRPERKGCHWQIPWGMFRAVTCRKRGAWASPGGQNFFPMQGCKVLYSALWPWIYHLSPFGPTVTRHSRTPGVSGRVGYPPLPFAQVAQGPPMRKRGVLTCHIAPVLPSCFRVAQPPRGVPRAVPCHKRDASARDGVGGG